VRHAKSASNIAMTLLPTNEGTSSMVTAARGIGRCSAAAMLAMYVAQQISVVVSPGPRNGPAVIA
jgi:hypothetical protein